MPISIAAANLTFGIGLLLVLRRAFLGQLKGAAVWNWVTILLVAAVLEDLLAMAVSSYGANYKGFGEDKWVLVACFLPLGLARTQEQASKAFYALMIGGLIAAAFAVFQSISGYNPLHDKMLESHGGGYMAVSFFTHHLTYAGIALVVLSISISWSLFGPGRKKLSSALFVSFLSAVGLFATFARSALVGLAGLAVPMLWGAPLKMRRWMLAAGAIGVVLFLLLMPGMATRFGYIFTSGTNDESPRIRLYQTSLNIISAHPFLGVGQGNWIKAFDDYHVVGRYVSNAHPHCDALSKAVNGGIPALLLFLGIWTAFFYQAVSAVRKLDQVGEARWGILAGMGGVGSILVAGLFQNYLSDAEVGNVVWFAVGLTLVLCRFARPEGTNA
jgi:O-antigen ligase